jgi:hypothetical protein
MKHNSQQLGTKLIIVFGYREQAQLLNDRLIDGLTMLQLREEVFLKLARNLLINCKAVKAQ